MAEPNELFFYYYPAFFAGFKNKDPNTILIWTTHPANVGYDIGKAIEIRPGDVPSTTDWNAVCVDDHSNSPNFGYTTIGPTFPHAYGAAGVYLRQVDPKVPRRCDETAFVCRRGPREPIYRYHGFLGHPLGGQLWVVYQPGTGLSQHHRPPRKVHVPAGSCLVPELVGEGEAAVAHLGGTPIPGNVTLEPNDNRATGIYIEREFAIYNAALDVPKRPSGAGPGMFGLGALTVSGPVGPNLSVLSAERTGELEQIATKLGGRFLEIGCHETLAEGLIDYHARWVKDARRTSFTRLDLIGHSRAGDMILKIGEHALTPRVIDREFSMLYQRGILTDFGIEEVRLLGCRTGAHAKAREIVDTLLQYVPKVSTVRADLFGVHYDPTGFLEASRTLLADEEVMSYSRPGDIPPEDDYPVVPGDDAVDLAPPGSLTTAALSLPNAAVVAAKHYRLWPEFAANPRLLFDHVHVDAPMRDNALVRADHEILVQLAVNPTSTDDYRSFDLVLTSGPPRVRVCANGVAHAFQFRSAESQTQVMKIIGL